MVIPVYSFPSLSLPLDKSKFHFHQCFPLSLCARKLLAHKRFCHIGTWRFWSTSLDLQFEWSLLSRQRPQLPLQSFELDICTAPARKVVSNWQTLALLMHFMVQFPVSEITYQALNSIPSRCESRKMRKYPEAATLLSQSGTWYGSDKRLSMSEPSTPLAVSVFFPQFPCEEQLASLCGEISRFSEFRPRYREQVPPSTEMLVISK